MRQCWVCDIADYAKFGILRRLAGNNLKLGVLWYLTTHAKPNKRNIHYLGRRDEYRAGDPDLFDALGRVYQQQDGNPTVQGLMRGGIFPQNTVYFDRALATSILQPDAREGARNSWFTAGLDTTKEADVVFLDPDTGLMRQDGGARRKKGGEYASLEEIIHLLQRGQSIVMVQFGRPGNLEADPQLARENLGRIAERVTALGHPRPWGLWWGDQHKVGLLVIPSEKHSTQLGERHEALMINPWWNRKIIPL